jgi:hypothetical protein
MTPENEQGIPAAREVCAESGIPAADISLYFPHAGKGQSVLVRFPGNRWFVIDANHPANGLPNASVELLRNPAEQPGFEVLGVVLTHLHADHYSGILELFEFFSQLAERRGCKLGDVVKALILPKSYDLFVQYVRDVGRPYLEEFLTRLESLSKEQITIEPLRHYDFAWRSVANGDLWPDEGWLVTYHPPSKAVNRWLLEGRSPDLPPPVKLGSSLIAADNRFVYILGVGYGRDSPDLHVLLTSDIPGEAFSDLTRDLRQSVLPAIQTRKAGAPYSLGLLIRQTSDMGAYDEGNTRVSLRPVQCLTVPHHGSGNCAKAEDLAWWLDEPDQEPGRPAFAMVQGGSRALQWKTLEELFKARLQVFATAKPGIFADLPPGHTGCSKLDSRIMAGAHRPAPSAQPSRVDDSDSPPPLSAHLAVHGGVGGIYQVMAQDIYRIVPHAPFWEHYDLELVYDASSPTGR